jgi:hypothetical protein
MTVGTPSEEQGQIVRFSALDDAHIKRAQPLSREMSGSQHNGLHCHWLPTLLALGLALLLSGCDFSALNATSSAQPTAAARSATHPSATRIRVYLD